jgi:N-acyl-D-aspartate/D-glutamate deacylase
MITFPGALFGLSDSGAHCTTLCDASFPTFALSYWSRDVTDDPIRAEHLVHCQTQRAAMYLGLGDRGVVAPGYLADLNVIDLEHLGVGRPRLVHDLPGGAARFVQDATGYHATVKRGAVVMSEGKPTGERTGRLVRGAQHRR